MHTTCAPYSNWSMPGPSANFSGSSSRRLRLAFEVSWNGHECRPCRPGGALPQVGPQITSTGPQMHGLIELDNVETLLREAEPFSGGNGLVTGVGDFARSILKFSSISVCEMLGYRLAAALGVRVP